MIFLGNYRSSSSDRLGKLQVNSSENSLHKDCSFQLSENKIDSNESLVIHDRKLLQMINNVSNEKKS